MGYGTQKNRPGGRFFFYAITSLFHLRAESIEGLAVTDDDELAIHETLNSFAFCRNVLNSRLTTFGHSVSGYHEVVVAWLGDVKELAVILAVILMEDEMERHFAVAASHNSGMMRIFRFIIDFYWLIFNSIAKPPPGAMRT